MLLVLQERLWRPPVCKIPHDRFIEKSPFCKNLIMCLISSLDAVLVIEDATNRIQSLRGVQSGARSKEVKGL